MLAYEVYQLIGTIAYLFVGPIAILIALIALRGFILFGNWRYLALSLSFFFLAIIPITTLIGFLGPQIISSSSFNDWYPVLYVVSLVVAWSLLIIIYNDERKKASIRITRKLWLMVAALMLPYIAWVVILASFGFGAYALPPLLWIIIFLPYVMLVLIIASLLAYYRSKKTENTLLTIVGFSFILVSQVTQILILIVFEQNIFFSPYYDLYKLTLVLLPTGEIFAMAGYVVILLAVMRVRAANV